MVESRGCLRSGSVFSYKLRYIVGFGLVEMAISTNQKPTIYRNLYENTGPGTSLSVTSRNPTFLKRKKWFDQNLLIDTIKHWFRSRPTYVLVWWKWKNTQLLMKYTAHWQFGEFVIQIMCRRRFLYQNSLQKRWNIFIKPRDQSVFFKFEIIINVLVSSFRYTGFTGLRPL